MTKESPLENLDETATSSTKKNASPEVEVVEKTVDTIEISPDPVQIPESQIPSNENTVCIFERKEEKVEISSKELSVSGNSFPFIIFIIFESVAILVLSSYRSFFEKFYSSEFFSRIAN